MRFPVRALALPLIALSWLGACGSGDSSDPASPETVELSGLPPTLRPLPVASSPPQTGPAATAATATSTGRDTSTTPATASPDAAFRFLDDIRPLVGDDGSFELSSPPVPVTDDTGRVTIRLPEAWPDRSTAPRSLPDGSQAPSIAAAPDLTIFDDGYQSAGLLLVVTPPDVDPDLVLANYGFEADCSEGASQPFSSGTLTGRYQLWTDCGGTPTDIVTVAAEPEDGSFTAVLLGQLQTDFDVDVLGEALSSLEVRDASGVGGG